MSPPYFFKFLQGWKVSGGWMSFDVCLEWMRMSEFLLWF